MLENPGKSGYENSDAQDKGVENPRFRRTSFVDGP